jgi:three-Cys-motif partner protein
MNQISEPPTTYGGPWTREKLNILGSYLNAYTTALKKWDFTLIYIDAFAGTGYVEFQDEDVDYFIRGSAAIATNTKDKPFDKLIFIEKNQNRCHELEKLKQAHSDRDIQIENSDANDYLKNLRQDWGKWRGVLFLDPFATQLQWATIETIASFNALDTWILFPTYAVARMLPRSKKPDDIRKGWAKRLTIVFGNESWRGLYKEPGQMSLFGDVGHVRDRGVEGLISIYKGNLESLFGNRFLKESRTLKNSNNSALFEFLFCVGHPNGIEPAKPIAKHLLERIQQSSDRVGSSD